MSRSGAANHLFFNGIYRFSVLVVKLHILPWYKCRLHRATLLFPYQSITSWPGVQQRFPNWQRVCMLWALGTLTWIADAFITRNIDAGSFWNISLCHLTTKFCSWNRTPSRLDHDFNLQQCHGLWREWRVSKFDKQHAIFFLLQCQCYPSTDTCHCHPNWEMPAFCHRGIFSTSQYRRLCMSRWGNPRWSPSTEKEITAGDNSAICWS